MRPFRSANYALNVDTFHRMVAPLMANEERWDPAWDQVLGSLHAEQCGFWIPRPIMSYAQHITNKEGLHFKRDGGREKGKLFPWDDFNWALSYSIDPEMGVSRCTRCAGTTCTAGGVKDGGVQLVNGMCPAFCSNWNKCGQSPAYQVRDCRGCEHENGPGS